MWGGRGRGQGGIEGGLKQWQLSGRVGRWRCVETWWGEGEGDIRGGERQERGDARWWRRRRGRKGRRGKSHREDCEEERDTIG